MFNHLGERKFIYVKFLFTLKLFLTKVIHVMTTPSGYGKRPRQARLELSLDRRFEACMKKLGLNESECLRLLIERGLLFMDYRDRDRQRKQERKDERRSRVSNDGPGASHHRGTPKNNPKKVQEPGISRKEGRTVESPKG